MPLNLPKTGSFSFLDMPCEGSRDCETGRCGDRGGPDREGVPGHSGSCLPGCWGQAAWTPAICAGHLTVCGGREEPEPVSGESDVKPQLRPQHFELLMVLILF